MLMFLFVFLCSGVSITRWWQPLWNLRSCGLLQSCVLPVPSLREWDGGDNKDTWAIFPTWWFKTWPFLGWWKTWPFQGVKWPPTRGWKGHFESPGNGCLVRESPQECPKHLDVGMELWVGRQDVFEQLGSFGERLLGDKYIKYGEYF